MIGRKNKPSEVRSKNIIYELHLEPRFGTMRIDDITTPVVARFRADLVAKKLGEKRINNILAVLSKPLTYAVDCEVLDKAPRIQRICGRAGLPARLFHTLRHTFGTHAALFGVNP